MKELPLVQSVDRGEATPGACSDGCCDVPPTDVDAQARGTAASGDAAVRAVVRIAGMDCASCAVTLERVTRRVPGVERATVNFATARLDVAHDGTVSDAAIERAVADAGFSVAPAGGVPVETSRWSWRMASTLVSALLFALGLALSLLDGVTPFDRSVELLFVVAIVVGGWPIFRAAAASLRVRHMDMNVLMGSAVVGAAIIGEWGEAAAVVVLFALGNSLQVYAVERTRRSVASLAELTPTDVLRRHGAEATLVPIDDVAVGDELIVRPGERVAVDARIVEGATTLDESPITGESVPVEKSVDDLVLSGSMNGAGSVVVRVEQVAANSTLQRIARLVEQAQGSRAPAELFIDRFSRIYTPLAVGSALLLMVAGSLFGSDASEWVYRGLALLIIACPCSLVISTPVTVVSGIGAAARRGILVKGGEALEHAGRLRALAFDKTGTLTEGRPTVASIRPLNGHAEGATIRLAAALERRSEHPLAHAILTAAGDMELPEVTAFTSIPGRGAEGTVEGASCLIGSPRLLAERGIALEADATRALDQLDEAGETPVILTVDQQPAAILGLADTIRPDAPAAIRELRSRGIHVVMLTGDSEGAARRVAGELGIDYRAQLTPEQKVEAVRALVDDHGSAGMVGDGINDAPSLAAATVSFAMGAAGTGAALEAADVTLLNDDLRRLATATALSREAEQVIRQNIVASLVIKGVFVLLAPFGLVTLWIAIAADMGTSLAVTANGLRLFRHASDLR